MSAHLTAAEAAHEAAVKEMFSGIAGRYERNRQAGSLFTSKATGLTIWAI